MKKKYLLYKTVDGESVRQKNFLYIERIHSYRFFYTHKLTKAKRFSLFQALLLSMAPRVSFVHEKLVRMYL